MSYRRDNYACEVCNRPYSNENACFNHELGCKYSNGINIVADQYMNRVLIYLLKENDKMREDLRGIKSGMNSEYKVFKRIFIPERWLYDNSNELDNIDDWLEQLVITNEQLHYMKKEDKTADYLKTISKILPEIVQNDCPIKCFDTCKNKIYIKNNDDWHLIEKEEIILIQNVLKDKLWEEWQRERRDNNIEDIEFDLLVQGGRYSSGNIQDRIVKALRKCNVLKLDSLIVPVYKDLGEE